ncbi:MAG: lytic murein transglycosylase [bacterium]|nr:lytic murein transglycosylase [bacterium]
MGFTKIFRRKIAFFALVAVIVGVSPVLISAQTTVSAVAEREAELRRELAELEAEIEKQQEILRSKQRESVSLERDIAILNARIEEAKLTIRAKTIRINGLTSDIGVKTEIIGDLEEKIEKNKSSLSELIRRTNEYDDYSLLELLLSQEEMSEFFADADSYFTLQSSLYSLVQNVKNNKNANENERNKLDQTRKAEIDARVDVEAEKRIIEKSEVEKKKLLAISKQEESAYEKVLEERQKKAASIRSALFALRDTAAIPFGEALEYATKASGKTGVRPAFILAILTQESNLGENVGTCNRPQDTKKWRDIMPGPDDNSWRDDQTVFQSLMDELGFDPDVMPLSCPYGGGWGGAMGPSQFIPTTWQAYKSRVAKVTGHNPPNPWNPEDAITATSLYLMDLGADKGGYSAELEAALRYYAGSNWNKPQNAFYGRQVLAHAEDIQENMIDPLNF